MEEKPVVRSKTVWLNVALLAVSGVLAFLIASPEFIELTRDNPRIILWLTVAAGAVSAIGNVALRFVTVQPLQNPLDPK
jgi:hypothetical protein